MTQFAPIPGTLVIGIGHRARQGKDVAANAIVKAFKGAQRVGFADDLYAYCRVMHGMTVKDAPLLQRVGVMMRESDPDVWVKAVYAKLLADKPVIAVIPDVRFENEMAFVRALGGVTVKVTRMNGVGGSQFLCPDRDPNHVSETALARARWDYEVNNYDGQQATFEVDVVDLVESIAIDRGRAVAVSVSSCCGDYFNCSEPCTVRGIELAKAQVVRSLDAL